MGRFDCLIEVTTSVGLTVVLLHRMNISYVCPFILIVLILLTDYHELINS